MTETVSTERLPKLPKPATFDFDHGADGGIPCYSEEQMKAYALKALASRTQEPAEPFAYTTPNIVEGFSDPRTIVGSIWPKRTAGEYATVPIYLTPPAPGRSKEEATADFRCPECGCRSYAPVDERKPDGSFAPGDLARCVHCKSVSKAPALGPASLHKGEVGQTLVGDELRGWIAYELTRRMVIDMPTARAAVDDAARRLEAVPPPRRQAAPITTDKSGPVLRETMWAKVIYEGEDNSFRFELNDEGNRDGPHYDRSIEFAADTFPAGTKIVVYEPDDEASPQPVTPSPKEVMVEAAPKSPFPAPLPVGVKVRDAVRQYLEQRTAAHEDGHTEKGSYFSTLDNLPDFVAAALSKPGEQG